MAPKPSSTSASATAAPSPANLCPCCLCYCNNGMFIGSASTVPFMLLAVQGLGTGLAGLPILTRVAMHFSYMRYGLEGLVLAVYGFGRGKLQCPLDEEYCPYRHPKQILRETGLEDASLLQAFGGLVGSYVAFRAVSYVLLRWRLSTRTRFPTIAYVGRLIKRHFRPTLDRTSAEKVTQGPNVGLTLFSEEGQIIKRHFRRGATHPPFRNFIPFVLFHADVEHDVDDNSTRQSSMIRLGRRKYLEKHLEEPEDNPTIRLTGMIHVTK
ncbi:ATP-binding cassette sub-family G member 1-like protein [Gryllus bimaculatus]|nr:ATP-binding cassette sub-family G member 1-like protein [Gryllus bimaculatus]